jgi:hypothetical protein
VLVYAADGKDFELEKEEGSDDDDNEERKSDGDD